MTQIIINTGTADKGNGDPIRTAFTKVNDNFTELYTLVGAASLTELAQDYAAEMFTDGTHVGVAVEYDDASNVINLTALGQTSSGSTAPVNPTAGTLWWDSVSGRLYVYYGSTWVDASPVDGVGISSTNELVNGAYTVSLGTDGSLTFPDGESSIYTLDPATSGGINGIAINGKDRTYIGIQNEAFGYGWDFRAFGLADYSTTLKPAIKFPGNGWLQEDYTDIMNNNVPLQLGSQGSITLTARLNGMSPTAYNWVFGRDGRTTFPNGTVPEHSYGAAGDKEGMVAFDTTYIYYCTADYVNNTTDIWKRVALDATPW